VGANSLAVLYADGHTTSQDYVFVYLAYAYRRDTDGMQDVAQQMNVDQIADAQRRVRSWLKPSAPCPPTAATSLPMPRPSTSAR